MAQFGGLPGAFVAMDVHNGEILGIGSYPTFDPSIFTRPVCRSPCTSALTSEATGAPLSTARSRAFIRPARPSS